MNKPYLFLLILLFFSCNNQPPSPTPFEQFTKQAGTQFDILATEIDISTLPLCLRYLGTADTKCRFVDYEKAILSIDENASSVKRSLAYNYAIYYVDRGSHQTEEWENDPIWQQIRRLSG